MLQSCWKGRFSPGRAVSPSLSPSACCKLIPGLEQQQIPQAHPISREKGVWAPGPGAGDKQWVKGSFSAGTDNSKKRLGLMGGI